jgi:hypothetical protein
LDDRLFELLDDLNIRDTQLLLDKDITLSVDSSTRKRIEKSIKRKTGYYNKNNIIIEKINNILREIFMKKRIALALAACAILSSGGGVYAYAKTPVAYVSMDINPSVELGVNAFDKVVSVEAYNDDGKKIIEGTDLRNYHIDNAISTLVSHAISEGYIKEDGSSAIEITTSIDKDNCERKLDESLKEVAHKTLNNNDVEADIETENVALARRDEARKLGITPGKLNLIQKLQELDSTITVEDYKDSSVKDIQKKTIELRKYNKMDGTTTDSNINADVVTEENNNPSNNNNKDNNSNNRNDKKEESSNANKENNNATTTIERQNNSNLKSENSSNSKSENNSSNSNSSKSENKDNGNQNSQNGGNGNSKSQNKGNGKNN